ncbi:MAG: hypothetical protein ACR2IG_09125, partial [Roseomonas sp.]
ASLIHFHSRQAWEALEELEEEREERQDIFFHLVRPYLEICAALVYVVHEAMTKNLLIRDAKYETILKQGDIKILEVFRHNVFHYNPKIRSKQHSELIEKNLVSWVQKLHDRHGVLVRRAIKFVRSHPKIDSFGAM